MNGDEFIIFYTRTRSNNRLAVVHLTKNRFGIWMIEITSQMDEHFNFSSTGWIDGIRLISFDQTLETYFEWHSVLYGDTATRELLVEDISEFIPLGIAVHVRQSQNEFLIHLITSIPEIKNSFDAKASNNRCYSCLYLFKTLSHIFFSSGFKKTSLYLTFTQPLPNWARGVSAFISSIISNSSV